MQTPLSIDVWRSGYWGGKSPNLVENKEKNSENKTLDKNSLKLEKNTGEKNRELDTLSERYLG